MRVSLGWMTVALVACGEPAADKDATETDVGETDVVDTDVAVDTDLGVDTDEAADTDVEDGPFTALSYGFESPFTGTFTTGWDGFTMTATRSNAGTLAVSPPTLNAPAGTQVGWIEMSPGGAEASQITMRSAAAWTPTAAGRSMAIVVLAAARTNYLLPLNGVQMRLMSGDTSRVSVTKGMGEFTGNGNFSPLVLTYTTTEADVGQPLSVEIASSAACCAGPIQVLFDELSWTVDAP